MASENFNPENELEVALIEDVFKTDSKQQFDDYTEDSPDELMPTNKNE